MTRGYRFNPQAMSKTGLVKPTFVEGWFKIYRYVYFHVSRSPLQSFRSNLFLICFDS